jgi:hypothetical protein
MRSWAQWRPCFFTACARNVLCGSVCLSVCIILSVLLKIVTAQEVSYKKIYVGLCIRQSLLGSKMVRILKQLNKPGMWSCCPIGDRNLNSLTLKRSLSSNLKSKSRFASTNGLLYIIQLFLRLHVRYLPVKLSVYLSIYLSIYGSIALYWALEVF